MCVHGRTLCTMHVPSSLALDLLWIFRIPPPAPESEAYLALNPQGKMPLLVFPDGSSLPESEVIVQYILDKHSKKGPSLLAETPELRAKAALVTRIHDLYIAPVQVGRGARSSWWYIPLDGAEAETFVPESTTLFSLNSFIFY